MKIDCHACGGELREIPRYADLSRVTSDCRIWPAGGTFGVCQDCGLAQTLVDDAWKAECDRIYGSYEIYAQSGGQEQVVRAGEGGLHPRSVSIVRHLETQAGLAAEGRVLDFGCGNGGFLRAFGREYPGWELQGLEFDDRNLDLLQAIPRFTTFYGKPEELPDEHLDLIACIHLLEHVPDPGAFLNLLKGRLRPGGRILIQVPNCAANPFILTVADHCSHFTPESLSGLLHRAGMPCHDLRTDVVAKELTVVVEPHAEVGNPANLPMEADPAAALTQFAASIESLLHYRETARAAGQPVAIFGSSIGGSWMAGELPDVAACFLDEDSSRWGREHCGLPICDPATVDPDQVVLVPLAREVARQVAGRLRRFREVVPYEG